MQRILASIIFSFLMCSSLWALSWSSVNIDKVTAAAMSAAYETQALEEGNTASNINRILDHYHSAGLASAGIFQSMKKLRDARRNPGLFASEENYYYQRIFRLVKDGIMPKFITVAGKMLKQPDNAIHWGPYLLKTTTNVENLCKQFEVVVTNGRRSFKDIRFLVLNEDLQKIFDLTQLGEVDWKSLLGKLGEFGTGITQEEIAEDYKNLGSIIAQAGKAAYDSNLESASKIGRIFKAKPKEIANLYESFKDHYESFKDASNIKELLFAVVGEGNEDAVDKLFQTSDYNLTGYISSYIKELQGEYYTQRWYIFKHDSGTEVKCEYDPSGYEGYGDVRWKEAWHVHASGKKRESYAKIPCYKPLSPNEDNELKDKLFQLTEWNAEKCQEYNQTHPGHQCTILYTRKHEDRKRHYEGGLLSHSYDERYCFNSYKVKVTDTWDIREVIYEETFDSQTMDKTTFIQKMKARLNGLIDENEKFLADHPTISIEMGSDNPRYYTMADEKKMEGCNSVSFIAQCDDGATLGEGSFNWKENGSQGNKLEWPKSKDFAMSNSPTADDGSKALLQKQKEFSDEVNALKSEIKGNDTKMRNLITRINQAKMNKNIPLVDKLQGEYYALSDENAHLKEQLREAEGKLSQADDALDEYYQDMSDNLDGPYRIPSNMASLASMYQIQWLDEGEWVQGSNAYVFVRHGYCADVRTNVTYTASLKLSRKPTYVLGVRIHRAVLSVDFKLTSSSSSENVIEVMKLNMNQTEKLRAEEVNRRLKQWLEDLPNCSVTVKYHYASNLNDEDDDEDGIHLLFAADRLQVARYVEQELTKIFAQLVLIEKVMTQRECILDFLRRQIFDVVSRSGRNGIAEYALRRWEGAGLEAMKKSSLAHKTEQQDSGNSND